MTKTVFIHQEELEKWLCRIDANDAAIVSYVESWYIGGEALVHPDDDMYVWIHLPTMLEQLPILPFGYEMLRKRVRRLESIGLLGRKYRHLPMSGNRAVYLKSMTPNLKKRKAEQDKLKKKRQK